MLFAADYPFLNIFWTMILFFFWVAWIWILVGIVADVFRRHDASGWVKAMWLFVLIFVPFLGVLAYLIVNGKGMAERHAAQAAASRRNSTSYVQSVAATQRRRRARSRRPRRCSTAARSRRPSSTR